jgi:hypothetical protein
MWLALRDQEGRTEGTHLKMVFTAAFLLTPETGKKIGNPIPALSRLLLE